MNHLIEDFLIFGEQLHRSFVELPVQSGIQVGIIRKVLKCKAVVVGGEMEILPGVVRIIRRFAPIRPVRSYWRYRPANPSRPFPCVTS